ncbi:hypothetical protein D3C72_672660 [compost metagenome]
MSDDQIGIGNEGSQPRHVDRLSRDHLVGNPRQAGDLFGNGNSRLPQPAIDAGDIADRTVIVECEGDDADFDDLVRAMVEARRFRVEDDALAGKFRPWPINDRARLQPAQDTIIAGGFKVSGKGLIVRSGLLGRFATTRFSPSFSLRKPR